MIEITQLLEPVVEGKDQQKREQDRCSRKGEAKLVHQFEEFAVEPGPFGFLVPACRSIREIRFPLLFVGHGFIVPQA